MHARIMLLPGSQQGKILCGYAEQILTDISAAFEHSFSLMRGKIGEASIGAFGRPLTEETAENCRKSQAVLLCDTQCPGAEELYDALDLPLSIRSCCVPEALCARHEIPVSLWVGTVLSLDEETLRRATASAYHFAREEEAALCHVAPSGASQQEWEAHFRAREAEYPQVPAKALAAPDAISQIIADPGRMGLVLCPPYAGSMLRAAATASCSRPGLIHDMAFDENTGVYAPLIPPLEEDDELNPLGMAYAIAKLLRYSLQLSREGACLEAAVQNVLTAGWRTPDLAASGAPKAGAQAIVKLICEQIAVAGELMNKGGIS